MSLEALLTKLARRDDPRTEALVQAEIHRFLLTAPLRLQEGDVQNILLESAVGDRRRIDIEVGSAVIEVKRDLRVGATRDEAVAQLRGYVQTRAEQTGGRYVGMLTDGAEWCCYDLQGDTLREVSRILVDPARLDLDEFVVWLEGVLATNDGLSPTPDEIRRRLGATSSSYALDRGTLASLYQRNAEVPTVVTKRRLWSRLLTSALGTQFDDTDELFVEHTLLVNSAEIIAHALLGLPVAELSPHSLLSGAQFDESGIYGVVESDFFDWVLEVEAGDRFVRSLAKRLGRFDWRTVEHDVLKVLYESVIGSETRKKLGEYYTPDWLAEKIVADVVSKPLEQRVLDPACGSGTFLFYAVRRVMDAAAEAGMSIGEAIQRATSQVVGMDLHPVAVTFARVTYLLAIGRDRLVDSERGNIQVPVYLGDSMQWNQAEADLWTASNLVIDTKDGSDLFPEELRFPDSLLADAQSFDRLVTEMADRAANRAPRSPVPSLAGTYKRLAVKPDEQAVLDKTFALMCRLHDEGKDHIWGYFVRNLARPLWLARAKNRVDVLVGNPPWLAYRHMPAEMQKRFKRLSDSRGLWHGAVIATHQDLSALFVARAAQLYLRVGGHLGMVLPNAVLDRAQFAGFRRGDYSDPVEPTALVFGRSWDLRRLRPHFFPRGSCVVFAKRAAQPYPLSADLDIWAGRVAESAVSWNSASEGITRGAGTAQYSEGVGSPYRARFTQGASMVPRVLLIVERRESGPLGVPAGRVRVSSARSNYEKNPWRSLDSLEGVLETQFIRSALFGEHVLPYRVIGATNCIVPWDGTRLLDPEDGSMAHYSGLSAWWAEASAAWLENRSSERLTLMQQLNYHGKLSAQLPITPMRVVYSKSGMHLAAALVNDPRAVIDHTLYWASVRSQAEGDYLCAILNAARLTELARPLMSYGKDERHIDKHVWHLPIPEYDEDDPRHHELASLAARLTGEIAAIGLNTATHFATLRRAVRSHIGRSQAGLRIEEIVQELLS